MSAQSSESLIVNGEHLRLDWVYPLEDYLQDHQELAQSTRWRKITTLSTSENRGYYGTWELKNNGFYLVNIYSYFIRHRGFWFWKKPYFVEATINQLFPEAVNNELKATWFTGAFSAFTSKQKNPQQDMLRVSIVKGDIDRYQWYHLVMKDGKQEKIPYERSL
jgi:hypothetical protein